MRNNRISFTLGNNTIECIYITSKEDLENIQSNDKLIKSGKIDVFSNLPIGSKNLDRVLQTANRSKTQEERQNMLDTYITSKIIKSIMQKIKKQKFIVGQKEIDLALIKTGIHTFETINYSGAKIYIDYGAIDVLSEILRKYKVELSIYLSIQDEEMLQSIINNFKAYDYKSIRIITNKEIQAKFLELIDNDIKKI